MNDKGWDKIKKQAEREDGQLLILPSGMEEAGALSGPTSDMPSNGKDNTLSSDKQGIDRECSETSENSKAGRKNGNVPGTAKGYGTKIEDFGEKIAGARKDLFSDVALSVENTTEQ